MKTFLHKATSRGTADYGWLKANYSFSFSEYYNPQRMNFGALRVLNDDVIDAGKGFGWHPHDNMEIVTIPLDGALEHKDSEGNSGVITTGEIQVMSAGTGIYHSEFNYLKNKSSNTLQTWIIPNKRHVNPRYGQFNYRDKLKENELLQIVSPDPNVEGMWIYQNCWYHIGLFSGNLNKEYKMKMKGNGVYFFVIDGDVKIEDHELSSRDALAISECDSFSFEIVNKAMVLMIEVPLR